MVARAWGHLHGCKAASGSSHLSSSFQPQPLHLPGYRCIEVAWVWIHACAARATWQVMTCHSMWIPKPKASQSQLRHHWTWVPGYSVGGWEMPILLARLRDFSIQTDHQPLIGIFQKPLGEVANLRIFWFWEKLLPHSRCLGCWQEESHCWCAFLQSMQCGLWWQKEVGRKLCIGQWYRH